MGLFAVYCIMASWGVAHGSTSDSISKERLNNYCRAVTSSRDSYCKSHKSPAVCHGSSISCLSEAVLRWEASIATTVPTTQLPHSSSTTVPSRPTESADVNSAIVTVTLKNQDEYCRTISGKSNSYCKVTVRSSKCHGATEISCSVSVVSAHLLSGAVRRSTTTKAPTTTTKTTTTTRTTTTTKAPTTTTTKAPTTSTPIAGPDPCELPDAVLLGRSPTSGNSYYMPLASMRACMMNTRISHANAIWTLHNMHFGIAESYSFTDLATGSLSSVHSNTCRHTVHPVEVDLVGEIVDQLASYNAILSTMSSDQVNAYLLEERPAYEFHSNLLTLMNRLHDAHTLYTTPFDMFRVYSPISFGSKIGPSGSQQITLRMSFDTADPLGRLAYVYRQVYGASLPMGSEYIGAVVTHINGIDALEFLKSMTFGELSASYQQSEQRLNAYIFSTSVLAFSQVLSTLPQYNSMILRFANGFEAKVKFLGQFADLSSSPYYNVPNLRSTPALSAYMHTNPAFAAFISQETDAAEKQETLWKYAASAAASGAPHGAGLTAANHARRALSKKHKSLLDPVSNLRRDNLLNVPLAYDPLNPDEDLDPVFVNADVLKNLITETLSIEQSSYFTELGGMSYSFVDDMVVVRVPSMVPEPRYNGDGNFYFFPDFVQVQEAARANGIRRLLFDVTGNGGGYVISAYALMWYVMADTSRICAPLRKRITPNWAIWIASFGDGLGPMVDQYLAPKGAGLVSEIDPIFAELANLMNLIFDGLGLPSDVLGSATKANALAQIAAVKQNILSKALRDQPAAIMKYLKGRTWLPAEIRYMVPSTGFAPFDPAELTTVGSSGLRFVPFLANYKSPNKKFWGKKSSDYSAPGEYAFCQDVLQTMPQLASGYDRSYWTQIAFVSDGTCGSACSLFTQGVQLSGSAVAFTYGGVADAAMDVASFAGGNVEEYADFWPQLALAARVGQIVSRGQSPWSKAHERTWVASPIAFPTRAGARFNWNMMFSSDMGPDALPRQFYLIPARKHLNMWASTSAELELIYHEIARTPSWRGIAPQFASSHGQCSAE